MLCTMIAGYLPLIVLPKKRVDFNPKKSIIQPLPLQDELWCNLNAEITRRKSTSSIGAADIVLDSPTMTTIAPSVVPEQSGRMIRLHRRFKKALTRLRKVFHHQSEVDKNKTECASPEPVRRTLVRRDSNVSNAKRLAAKRKRPSFPTIESMETDGWMRKFQSRNVSLTREPETSEITSELQEIFEHLTVSVSKRPRLDSNDIACRIFAC